MLKWAVVDPGDRLLDANIGSGMMAEYLRRNMQCEVCGVSDNMESVRAARSRLQNSDIVYAVPGDIPWHEEVFDTVLMKLDGQEERRERAPRACPSTQPAPAASGLPHITISAPPEQATLIYADRCQNYELLGGPKAGEWLTGDGGRLLGCWQCSTS